MTKDRRLLLRAKLLAELGPMPRWWRAWRRRTWRLRHRAIMAMDTSQFADLLDNLYPAQVIAVLAERLLPAFERIERIERIERARDGK